MENRITMEKLNGLEMMNSKTLYKKYRKSGVHK